MFFESFKFAFQFFIILHFLKQVFQVKVQLFSKVRCLIFDNFFHFMLQLGFYVTSNSTSIQFSSPCRIFGLNLVLMCSLIFSLNLVLMSSLIFSFNLVLMCSLIFRLNLVLICSLIFSLNLVLMSSLIFSLNLVLMSSLIFSLNLVLMRVVSTSALPKIRCDLTLDR